MDSHLSAFTVFLAPFRVARLATFVAKLNHKQIICGLRPPYFVVAEGHNIFEVTKRLFAAFGRHSLRVKKFLTTLSQ